MAIELPDARELSDESLQVIRLRALHGIELGFSETDLANLLGVCTRPSVAGGLPIVPMACIRCLGVVRADLWALDASWLSSRPTASRG